MQSYPMNIVSSAYQHNISSLTILHALPVTKVGSTMNNNLFASSLHYSAAYSLHSSAAYSPTTTAWPGFTICLNCHGTILGIHQRCKIFKSQFVTILIVTSRHMLCAISSVCMHKQEGKKFINIYPELIQVWIAVTDIIMIKRTKL